MYRRDIATALFSSATAAALISRAAEAQTCTSPCYPATPAESGVSIVNTTYPPGHVYRYGTNTTPKTTDMAPAINAAANVCRNGGYTLLVPMTDILLVNGSLDFGGIRVVGLGDAFNTPKIVPPGSGYIYASPNGTFDVITSTGLTIIENICVDGGWDGSTPGLTGNILSIKAASTTFPYVISVTNCTFTNAKQTGIYIERGGYTSFFHVRVLGCGLHALHCRGLGTADQGCTTIRDYGSSQFGSTPNGYGIVLENCASCAFRDSIIEQTYGILLKGINNRSITFDGVYQEFNYGSPPLFITDGSPAGAGSSGIGLVVRGCYGSGASVPSLPNWAQVYFEGNSLLGVPTNAKIVQGDGGEQLASATGDVTAASVTLNMGTYLVFGTVQTVVNVGSGSITQLACNVSTNASASGIANSTNSASFSAGADQQSYTPDSGISDLRVNCFTWLQITAQNTPVYLRAHIALNGSVTVGYHGMLNAVLVQ